MGNNARRITCQFFDWKLRQRNGVWQADGRTQKDKPSAGRHSLSTKDYNEAIEMLKTLDTVKAVELGLCNKDSIVELSAASLKLDSGIAKYFDFCRRADIVGGVKPRTVQRYEAVFSKVLAYFKSIGLIEWHQVKKRHLEGYAGWLAKEGYAYQTQLYELTAIKSAMCWMIREDLLPASAKINLTIEKVTETTTYCYTSDEVKAMVQHCRNTHGLNWMGDLIIGLALTGMRISELANLRWSNVDLDKRFITLVDRSRGRKSGTAIQPTTKNRRGRSFPIQTELMDVLNRLKINETEFVFLAARGGRLRTRNVLHDFINSVIEPLKSQFPAEDGEQGFQDGRLHSFRHFFCSWCANQQVAEPVLMSWLGHHSSAMVRRYYHLNDKEAHIQMSKLKPMGFNEAS